MDLSSFGSLEFSTLSVFSTNETSSTLPSLVLPFDVNLTSSRYLKAVSTGSPSASSLSSSSAHSRDENLAILEIITLSAIFVMIVFGNTSVLLALILSRIKLRRMYFFLLHLSIADLITAFANVLPQLIWEITERFYGGNVLCKGIKYLQILGPYLSSFTLCATAIDRYRAICFPLESRSALNRSKLKVSIAWGLALICCLPQLFIFSYRQIPNSPGVYECWGTFIQPYGERLYVTWYALTSFFIPFVILIFTFSNICLELWRNGRRIKKANLTTSTRRTSSNNDQCTPRSHSTAYFSKAKIKTVKLTVTIIICYICCSSPFNVVQIWAYWAPGAQERPLITIAMLLPSLNSCVNPWIYLFFNRNLLSTLDKLFCYCSTNTNINAGNRSKTLDDSSVNIEPHCSSINRNGSRTIFVSQKMSKYSDDKPSVEAHG
uniref:G-protein coupled receptors family 1 profile domain-containing protein n=1 Tax=Tetranychus urticae TaxID=32264 RepID=T1KNR7_TETUR